jgi:hypothetical protein
MRERPQLSVQGGLTKGERTLREDWPVVDGSWRHAGAEELPCELVREWHFLGSGVPAKQLRSRREEMGIREREKAGWGGGGWESKVSAGRARSVPGTQPEPSHGNKC